MGKQVSSKATLASNNLETVLGRDGCEQKALGGCLCSSTPRASRSWIQLTPYLKSSLHEELPKLFMLESELATCGFSTADTILLLVHSICCPTTPLAPAMHSGDRAATWRNQGFNHSLLTQAFRELRKKNVFPCLSPVGSLSWPAH